MSPCGTNSIFASSSSVTDSPSASVAVTVIVTKPSDPSAPDRTVNTAPSTDTVASAASPDRAV